MEAQTPMQFFRALTSVSRQCAEQVEPFLKRWGALAVLAVAICYYGAYYRSGLNLGGEGGTVAMVAMRLMEGQRPFVDTFLGYNVMWFYPVAWLFELTGPSYIALRLYFFAICTITALMAFFIVRRVSGSGLYATLAALGPLLIPGMLFRNYMAFMAMLNMLTLLQAYVFEQRRAWVRFLWMVAAGVALGLTFLIRIDIGAFFAVITLGLLVLYPLGIPGGFRRRLRWSLLGLVSTVVLFLGTQAPFYWDAERRGYAEGFTSQYTGWLGLIGYLASQQVAAKPAETPAATPAPVATPAAPAAVSPATPAAAATPPETKGGDIDSDNYLKKRSPLAIFRARSAEESIFALVTYLPILVAGLIVVPAAFLLLAAVVWRDPWLKGQALVLLISTGSALTLFPQYFFFRPDTPHLSEFMAPFLVAIACALWIFWGWRNVGRAALAICVFAGALLLTDVALYFIHALPKESAGTIAAREKKNYELTAENGVRVWVKKQERDELSQLVQLVHDHTKPGDYLVTYPYSPTVNFMTDRPSYEYNLYVDNASGVANFYSETLAEIARFRPAVIVIDNRPINHTEDSRFRNWAASTYEWIRQHYAYAGTFRRQEVYFRPDLYAPSVP